MKWFKTEQVGFQGKQKMTTGEGAGDCRDGKPISKMMGIMGGNAKAVWLHGVKIWTDDSGIVIRGPDLLIGHRYEDLKNVPVSILLDINMANTISRGMALMNNKVLSPEEQAAVKQYENAKIKFSKAVEEWNAPRYGRNGTVAK